MMRRSWWLAVLVVLGVTDASAQTRTRPPGEDSRPLFGPVRIDQAAPLASAGASTASRIVEHGCEVSHGSRVCRYGDPQIGEILVSSHFQDGYVDAAEIRLRRPVSEPALELLQSLMMRSGGFPSSELAGRAFGEAAMAALMDGVSGSKETERLRIALRIEDTSRLRVFLQR